MPGNYIVTNTWTQARHGHAHDELLSIKHLLESSSFKTKILSIDPEFGDLRVRSLGRSLQSLQFHRSRILKPLVDSSYGRDLSRGIINSNTGEQPTETRVAITSSRFQHILRLEDALRLYVEPRIRILDEPKNRLEWGRLAQFRSDLGSGTSIAMEVKDSVVESQKYLDGVIHLPSHYAMQTESADINKARNRLGIFWPVGRSFSTREVLTLLDQLKLLDPIVKLPTSMGVNDFAGLYPGIEFVEKGLGNEQFRGILSRIKVAILGHRGYRNQSSGYAGYFLANNVPVLASSSNSFFSEINTQGQVYDLDKNMHQTVDLLTTLMDSTLNLKRNPYAIFVENAWKTFLLDKKI